MFIVLGRLFMRGSKGVSTGGPDTPSRMEKHKAVIILGLLVRKVQSYRCRANEAPFIWRFAGGPMVARFGYFLCPCKFTAMNTVK